ncbi:MAG: hypothetical protein ACK4ZW_09000 [Blastomonas sp.]|jgi:hypothetical protein
MAILSLLFIRFCLGDYRNRSGLARASALPISTRSMQKCPDAARRVAEKLVPPLQQG